MCLIAAAWQTHPRFSLALIANRDEFHARPATAAAFAPDDPAVFGGRDLVQGGSWLQVHAAGRLAAVTNVRVGPMPEAAPRSRGSLVHALARDPGAAWVSLPMQAGQYGRFNVLAWDGATLAFASNHPQWHRRDVAPGIHGVSNGDLDTPWPKVRRAQAALVAWLDSPQAALEEPDVEALFAALANPQRAPDAELPDTGVGLALEQRLSSTFIVGTDYGTRCSTVVLVDREGIVFHERRFGPDGVYAGQTRRRLGRAP